MFPKILLLILMVGAVFAAPWKLDSALTETSAQPSSGKVTGTSNLLTTSRASTTAGNALSSLLSSLFPSGPISLPPDTINSTLLPPPPTSAPPNSFSFDIPSTSAVVSPTLAPTVSATVTASNSITTSMSTKIIGSGTLSAPNPFGTPTMHKSSMLSMSTKLIGSGTLSAPSPFETPIMHKSSMLSMSTKIIGSGTLSAPNPWGTMHCPPGKPCPPSNDKRGSDDSSSVSEISSDEFVVYLTVSGGNFLGGKSFNVSGTYHGNCTNGVLNTDMGSTDVDIRKACGNDLMCVAGELMSRLGSVVTEIMNPSPAGMHPARFPRGLAGREDSRDTGFYTSSIPSSASDAEIWSTVMVSGSMTTTLASPTGFMFKTSKMPLSASKAETWSTHIVSESMKPALEAPTENGFKTTNTPVLSGTAGPTGTDYYSYPYGSAVRTHDYDSYPFVGPTTTESGTPSMKTDS